MKRLSVVALFLAPLVLVGAILYASGTRGQQEFQSPSTWVPFTADLHRVNETGNVYVGRRYRAADGSSRSDTGPGLDRITAININNVTRRTNYRWLHQTGWTQAPMDLPPNGWQPPKRVMMPEINYTVGTFEGLQAVRVERGGIAQTEIPALNWLMVAMERPDCGGAGKHCSFRLTNIKIDEPPAELFQPPPGAEVEVQSEPAGIVRGKH